ncbi:MAG: heme exporter protein CcmB [Coriobacteriia bacterium]|nr:heme exporter protein CcmB [Coriobacteriia bacterium]
MTVEPDQDKQKQIASAVKVKRPSTASQFVTLFARDIRQEMRTREMLSSMGFYALLVLLVLGVALAQADSSFQITSISGGLLWVMIVFTSLLGLNRSFTSEREDGGLEGVLLVPLDRSIIFLAKMAANLVFLLVVEMIACPLFFFFFMSQNAASASIALVVMPLLIGSIGIAAVGTLLATITSGARGRDVLLAMLFIPVIFPLLYAVVSATSVTIANTEALSSAFISSLAMAAGYDVIMLSVSWLLYDFVITD